MIFTSFFESDFVDGQSDQAMRKRKLPRPVTSTCTSNQQPLRVVKSAGLSCDCRDDGGCKTPEKAHDTIISYLIRHSHDSDDDGG